MSATATTATTAITATTATTSKEPLQVENEEECISNVIHSPLSSAPEEVSVEHLLQQIQGLLRDMSESTEDISHEEHLQMSYASEGLDALRTKLRSRVPTADELTDMYYEFDRILVRLYRRVLV